MGWPTLSRTPTTSAPPTPPHSARAPLNPSERPSRDSPPVTFRQPASMSSVPSRSMSRRSSLICPSHDHLFPSGASAFACLIFGNGQEITALRLPAPVIPYLTKAISRTWHEGLLRSAASTVPRGWEWELNGWPFVQHTGSRRLVFAMLSVLYAAGWEVAASNNMNKHHLAKGTVFLRPGVARAKEFFGISFFKDDRIRLIDPPSGEVREVFVGVCQSWHKSTQEVTEMEHGCTQVKLRGCPFHTSDRLEQEMSRLLMLDMLSAFDALGYELVTCIEMADFVRHQATQAETWFFANKTHPKDMRYQEEVSVCSA